MFLPVANLVVPVIAPLFGTSFWMLPFFLVIVVLFEWGLFRLLNGRTTCMGRLVLVLLGANTASAIPGQFIADRLDYWLRSSWASNPGRSELHGLGTLFGLYALLCVFTILIELPIIRAAARSCQLERAAVRTVIVNAGSYACIIALLFLGWYWYIPSF